MVAVAYGRIEQHAQGLGPDADAPERQRHQRHEQPDTAAATAVLFPFGLETLVLRHQRISSASLYRHLYAHHKQYG